MPTGNLQLDESIPFLRFCGLHYLAKTFVVPVDIGKNLKYAFLNEIT
jgi:hypothetical protein